jgi:hypothetical protein
MKTYSAFSKLQITVFVIVSGIILGALLGLSFRSRANESSTNSLASIKSFAGGKFEASGVAHVPGTDGVLFVDDGRTNEIFWMPVGEARTQDGEIKSIQLGASVVDLEGITSDGTYFYVVGSQSKSTGFDQVGLVRFKFDPKSQRVEAVETISELKKFLAENVSELKGLTNTKYKDGGINVEGLAWDSSSGQLLLGLRSPVVDGMALVVPLELGENGKGFTRENLRLAEKGTIKLPLEGNGIRSIEFDDRRKAFSVISGAAANNEKADFRLWEWDGNRTSPSMKPVDQFDRKSKPEGITRFSSAARDFTFIVFDTSGYAALD